MWIDCFILFWMLNHNLCWGKKKLFVCLFLGPSQIFLYVLLVQKNVVCLEASI